VALRQEQGYSTADGYHLLISSLMDDSVVAILGFGCLNLGRPDCHRCCHRCQL